MERLTKSMSNNAYHILRIGIGITFVWIGILIVQEPLVWGSYINPWAEQLLLLSKTTTMMIVGIFDIIIGALFIINRLKKITAVLASLHIINVLVVSGFNNATIRDIGLLGGTLALYFYKK